MLATANEDPIETLTERERQCLRLVFDRLRPKEIGRELGISHHTVNGHLQQAMRKLGASSSIEAARQVYANERQSSPESVTGYPFGVEYLHDQSSLAPSSQGGAGSDRVRDGVFGEQWTADAAPFVSDVPRFRWPLPGRGENRNDLTPTERLLWIAIGIIAVAIIAFLGTAAAESIQRTLQATFINIK